MAGNIFKNNNKDKTTENGLKLKIVKDTQELSP